MRLFAHWPLTLLLALATIALSAVGAYGLQPQARWIGPLDWLVGTISLFKLSWFWPPGFQATWPVQVARFTGAFFTLSALGKVWMRFFGDQVTRYRLGRWTDHVVICGLGRKGQQLALELRRRKQRVAISDAAPVEDDVALCRQSGVLVETGDSTKDITLEALGVERARYVFAVCRDDHTNLEIGMETLARFRASGRSGPLSCYVHLVNLPLRVLLQRHELLKARPPGFDLRFFNIYENTARALLAAYPPDTMPGAVDGRVHLVVVGCTRLGEAVATQAARVGHYRDLRPVRVTIVDDDAERRGEQLLTRLPGLADACELRFLSLRLTDPRFTKLEFLEPAAAKERVAMVLCQERDEQNVSLALTLVEHTGGKIPLLANVSERRGLASLLRESQTELAEKGIHFFGAVEEVCGWDLLREEQLDTLAKSFAKFYQARHGGADWTDLSEDLRNSNRAAADHIDVKLRTVGCHRVAENGGAAAFAFSLDEVELLARMEHERWSADRRLNGWVFGEVRDNARKLHHNLVTWDRLTEADREKDREQVRDLPMVLAGAGFTVQCASAVSINAGPAPQST